jgi:hypothetical protein
MFRGRRSSTDTSQQGGDESLHERVRAGLAQGFRGSISDYSLGQSEADVLVHRGSRVAVFEVKTGDPNLPLPSSTFAQMLLLKQQVQKQFPPQDVEEVVPVVITNYKVTADDEKELEDQGIKVVRIDAAASGGYDFGKVSRQVADLTGFQTDLV